VTAWGRGGGEKRLREKGKTRSLKRRSNKRSESGEKKGEMWERGRGDGSKEKNLSKDQTSGLRHATRRVPPLQGEKRGQAKRAGERIVRQLFAVTGKCSGKRNGVVENTKGKGGNGRKKLGKIPCCGCKPNLGGSEERGKMTPQRIRGILWGRRKEGGVER